ncbi:MAG: hypothetical protein RIE52_03465 [Balneola sp.]|jgi:hypothetical protein
MRTKKLHRATFICAGVYNLIWGLYSAIDPQWFFRISGLPLLNHPEIFACLGMVIGLYGILYFEVARNPESSFLIALIGFIGKVLGPLGWLYLFLTNTWPLKSILLILTNDLIWWIPFLMYLSDYKDIYINDLKK